MNSPEYSHQQNSSEINIETNEALGLKESIVEFLKSKGVDSSFVPVIKTNDNGNLSVEILKDGKSVFNGYSTAIPFNIGKEKIIEGVKEAIVYWIEDGQYEGLKIGQAISDEELLKIQKRYTV